MKNRSILVFSLLLALLFTGCDKETVLQDSDFPVEIQLYVDTHFPIGEIIQIVRENEDFVVTYDVFLSDHTSLEFNKKYEVTSISSRRSLPESVIPVIVLEFVKARYPQQFIVEWELERKIQQIELNSGLELIFDQQGEFLRLDN